MCSVMERARFSNTAAAATGGGGGDDHSSSNIGIGRLVLAVALAADMMTEAKLTMYPLEDMSNARATVDAMQAKSAQVTRKASETGTPRSRPCKYTRERTTDSEKQTFGFLA